MRALSKITRSSFPFTGCVPAALTFNRCFASGLPGSRRAGQVFDTCPTKQVPATHSTKRPPTSSPPIVTPSTEQHHNKVVRASDAVSRAHYWLERAQGNVLKLELRCAAFECKQNGKDENELKTILDSVASRVPDSPFVTAIKDMAVFDFNGVANDQAAAELKDAKAELIKAEIKLKEAESELEEAVAELEEAEAELKHAEAAIEKAKAEVPAAELAPYVKAAWSNGQLRIASLSAGAIGKAQGMTELVKDMTRRLERLEDWGRDFVGQDTVAFVLTCSPGVGKTFFSLAAAKPLSEALKGTVGTLCLGFNSDAPLQPRERECIEQDQSYYSVRLVLFRRLLIQLECLLAWKREPRNGTCTPFEFDEYGLQHVVQMDADALASLPLAAKDLYSSAPQEKALELLSAVQKAYKLSHLMLVIDEGQILDGLIQPVSSYDRGGARFALRWARELQLAAHERKCGLLCFGLMTGIDPQTWIADPRTGNDELWHLPMTREDFKKLTKCALEAAIRRQRAVSSKPCNVALSEALIDLVAASYFPDARAVSRIQFDDDGSLVSLPQYRLAHLFDAATRRELAVMALARIVMDNTDWARTIPSAWTETGYRIPCPSYAMTVELLGKDIFPSLPKESLTVGDEGFEFEALAAATLQLLIWVREEEVNIARQLWRPVFAIEHIFTDAAVGSKMERAFPWTIRGCFAEYPSDTMNMHYPSSMLDTHGAAFAVGKKSPKLADKFKESTDKLHNAAENDANTLFFRCGGGAPIDFVILHKRDKTTEWRLTLADAKLTTTSASQLASRGDMVFRYLAKQLKEEYKVTLTWDRTVLLLTDAACDDDAVSKVPLETPRAEPVTIVRLTRSTFQMGSVTEYLFARRACVAAGGMHEEKEHDKFE